MDETNEVEELEQELATCRRYFIDTIKRLTEAEKRAEAAEAKVEELRAEIEQLRDYLSKEIARRTQLSGRDDDA